MIQKASHVTNFCVLDVDHASPESASAVSTSSSTGVARLVARSASKTCICRRIRCGAFTTAVLLLVDCSWIMRSLIVFLSVSRPPQLILEVHMCGFGDIQPPVVLYQHPGVGLQVTTVQPARLGIVRWKQINVCSSRNDSSKMCLESAPHPNLNPPPMTLHFGAWSGFGPCRCGHGMG